MMESTVTANANPRPVYRIITVALGIAIIVLILTAITLFFTYKGSATSADLATQGKRRDCVSTLNNARRAVFDDVDIYKAIEIQLLSTALLDNANGIVRTQAEKDMVKAIYQANDDKLKVAIVEASRIRPASFANGLIEHGGVVDGVRYAACPG